MTYANSRSQSPTQTHCVNLQVPPFRAARLPCWQPNCMMQIWYLILASSSPPAAPQQSTHTLPSPSIFRHVCPAWPLTSDWPNTSSCTCGLRESPPPSFLFSCHPQRFCNRFVTNTWKCSQFSPLPRAAFPSPSVLLCCSASALSQTSTPWHHRHVRKGSATS